MVEMGYIGNKDKEKYHIWEKVGLAAICLVMIITTCWSAMAYDDDNFTISYQGVVSDKDGNDLGSTAQVRIIINDSSGTVYVNNIDTIETYLDGRSGFDRNFENLSLIYNNEYILNVIVSGQTVISETFKAGVGLITGDSIQDGTITISDFNMSSVIMNSTSWNTSGSNVFLTDLSNNVGIGTSTPSNELNVVGTINTSKLLVGNGEFDAYNIMDVYGNNITTEDSYTTADSATLDYSARIGGTFNDNAPHWGDPSFSALVLTAKTTDGADYYFADPLYIEKVTKNGGTIASIAAIYIADQDAATNNWAIASNEGYVYHGDNVIINPPATWFDPTDTPTEALEVIGNITITQYYKGDGSLLTNLPSGQANSTSWNRTGTNVFLHNTGDNVGIGTVTPSHKLNVVGSANITGDLIVAGNNITGDYVPYTGANKDVELNDKKLMNFSNLQTNNAIASGTDSIALMSTAETKDSYSLAIGYGALGDTAYTTAIGVYAKSYEQYSIAIGYSAQTHGNRALALGRGTNASGYGSTALGHEAESHAWYSTAIGNYANATGDYSVAIGRNTQCTLENATCIDGGYVGIGTASPSHKLNVVGSANITGDLIVAGNNITGDYVPYTGANKDVDLGNYNLSTSKNIIVSKDIISGGTFNTTSDVGIEIENWANFWAFKYDPDLVGGLVGNTGMLFNVTGNFYEIVVTNSRIWSIDTANLIANFTGDFEIGGDLRVLGNTTSPYFIGDGSQLTNLPTGDNQSFNQTLTDTLYASISVVGDNASWNETYANTLYATLTSLTNNMTLAYNNDSRLESKINSMDNISIADIEGNINSTSWNRTGTNVFLHNTGDNVGIGTSTPSDKLNVVGNVNITENLTIGNNKLIKFINSTGKYDGTTIFKASGNDLQIRSGSTLAIRSLEDKDVRFQNSSNVTTIKIDQSTGKGMLSINDGTGVPTHELTVVGSGNITKNLTVGDSVGIGTTPITSLHIMKGTGVTDPTLEPTIDLAIFEANAGTNGAIQLLTDNDKIGGYFFSDPELRNVGGVSYDHSTEKIYLTTVNGEAILQTNSIDRLTVQNDGDINLEDSIFVDESTQNVLIGANAGSENPVTDLEVSYNGGGNSRGITSSMFNSGNGGGAINIRKARGTRASPLVVEDGNSIGFVIARAYDGSDFLPTAGMLFGVNDATPTVGDVKTDMWFTTDSTGGLARTMTLMWNGNVGIGTATPSQRLEVNGSANITDALIVGGKGYVGNSQITQKFNVGNGLGTTANWITVDAPSDKTSGIRFYDATNVAWGTMRSASTGSYDIYNYYTGSYGISITNDTTYVGIGTITPSHKLNVLGSTNITGGLIIDTDTLYVDNTTNKVGIGTSTPSHELNVVGDVNITQNLYVKGGMNVTQDARFERNVTIVGNLIGGSPVKIVGGLNVDNELLINNNTISNVMVNETVNIDGRLKIDNSILIYNNTIITTIVNTTIDFPQKIKVNELEITKKGFSSHGRGKIKDDIEIENSSRGLILTSQNNSKWLTWVDDNGNLFTTKIASSPEISFEERVVLINAKTIEMKKAKQAIIKYRQDYENAKTIQEKADAIDNRLRVIEKWLAKTS